MILGAQGILELLGSAKPMVLGLQLQGLGCIAPTESICMILWILPQLSNIQ